MIFYCDELNEIMWFKGMILDGDGKLKWHLEHNFEHQEPDDYEWVFIGLIV